MGQGIAASVRFPTITLTSALVILLGFWLLVLLGRETYASSTPTPLR